MLPSGGCCDPSCSIIPDDMEVDDDAVTSTPAVDEAEVETAVLRVLVVDAPESVKVIDVEKV